MRKYYLCLLAALALALPAAAADYPQALKNLKPRLDSSVFSGASVSAQNQLILTATDKYKAMTSSLRYQQAYTALLSWHSVLSPGAPANLLLSIKWKNGGELWLLKDSGPAKIDEWADTRLPFTPSQPNTDRFFGYLGGQLMKGGSSVGSNMTAFNGRLGKTFLRGRCDAAAIYGYSKLGDAGLSSYGLTGRVLFPLTDKMGWNLGGSFTRSAPSTGDAVNSIAALGGLNFYLPGGSFDVTASVGNNSMYSLLFGYTLFLTRK